MSITNLYQLDRRLLGDIAISVQALMRMASLSLGSDCIQHALLALQLLEREGVCVFHAHSATHSTGIRPLIPR